MGGGWVDDDGDVATAGGDDDGENESGRVLFRTEGTGAVYQLIMVYPDIWLGFLTRNQSFCRKNKHKPLKFPLKFDCPTTWSTLETLGNARQNEQYDIVSSAVSKAL